MNEIKFSHWYFKLKDKDTDEFVKFAELLQIFKCHYKDLSKEFILFDTLYPNDLYDLPKTKLIVLLFRFGEQKFFTTIRRYTKNKYTYYKNRMGEMFEIIIP